MRLFILAVSLPLLAASCSSSRTVDAERIIEPGRHVSQSVMGSDILIQKGSALAVSFSSGNRFYVGSGGALTGFQSGARNTRIYAESGAHLPEEKYLSNAQVINVSSAGRSFRNRFQELPPLKSGGSEVVDNNSSIDDDEDCDHDDRRGGRSRAVSVTPASYERKD